MAHLDRDDVLARVDLAEILTREVGPPHKRGVEWWWPSVEPGMEGTGRTPPTHIIPPTAASNGVAMFKDFASGTSGTAIDVLMIRRGFDFTTALQALANDAGLTSRVPPPPLPPSRQQARPRPQPPSAELITWVRDCAARLATPAHRPSARARQWLRDRGFADQVVTANLVGYDPGARHDPHRPRRERERHGIANMAGVTFPMFDAAGNVAYVQTRSLTWTPDSEYPKYVNPTGVTNPGVGIWATSGAATAGAPVLVTEGPTDSLAARQAGHDVAGLIGASHANNPDTAAKLVASFGADRPYVIVTDPDDAGRHAGQSLTVHLSIAGATAIWRPPPGGDVADWANTAGQDFPHQLQRHIDHALADVSAATRQALAGDAAFIETVAGGPLHTGIAEVWASYRSSILSTGSNRSRPASSALEELRPYRRRPARSGATSEVRR